MKIQIRYDLASVPQYARGNLPDSLAGKVFPVIAENEHTYQIKQRHGRSIQFITHFVLKQLCVIHKQRTRHGNKTNSTAKNNH